MSETKKYTPRPIHYGGLVKPPARRLHAIGKGVEGTLAYVEERADAELYRHAPEMAELLLRLAPKVCNRECAEIQSLLRKAGVIG